MNTRRNFLQKTALLSATGLLAKTSNAFHKNLQFLEEKIIHKSFRNVGVAHTAFLNDAALPNEKIRVSGKALQAGAENDAAEFTVNIYQKSLIKTALISCSHPELYAGALSGAFVNRLNQQAKALKETENCQLIICYLNIPIPAPEKILQKDFWVAKLHSVDLLFTTPDPKQNYTRVCQGLQKTEIIISPLNNRKDGFGKVDILFDAVFNKKNISIS
jgi:hypothetical protein